MARSNIVCVLVISTRSIIPPRWWPTPTLRITPAPLDSRRMAVGVRRAMARVYTSQYRTRRLEGWQTSGWSHALARVKSVSDVTALKPIYFDNLILEDETGVKEAWYLAVERIRMKPGVYKGRYCSGMDQERSFLGVHSAGFMAGHYAGYFGSRASSTDSDLVSSRRHRLVGYTSRVRIYG